MATTVDGVLKEESKERWQARVDDFFVKHKQGKRKKATQQLKDPGLANESSLRAVDHALVGTMGIGLVRFKAPRPLKALAQHEERFWVETDSLPEAIRVSGGERVRRACIRDKSGPEPTTRLEVLWSESRNILHTELDMGACDWPSKHLLYLDWGVRGSFHNDPHHRRWDNCVNAMNQCGCNMVKMEASVVFSFTTGPWHNCGNFGNLKDAMDQWGRSCTHDDPLFQFMYPKIVRDLHEGRLPEGFGSEEHRLSVWKALPEHIVFLQKGMRTKLNRWYQLLQKCKTFRPYRSMVMAVLMYVGIHRGWWHGVEDTPCFAHEPSSGASAVAARPQATEAPSQAAVKSSGSVGRSVRLSNEGVKTLRDHCQGGMHLACTILGMEETWALMSGMAAIAGPSHEEHSKTVTILKTKKGTLDWKCSMAAEHHWQYLQDTMDMLFDRGLMLKLGLVSYEGGPTQSLFDDVVATRVSATLMDFARLLLAKEITFYRTYSEDLPSRFASLVHTSADCRAAGAKWVRDAFEVVTGAEAAAFDDPWLQDYIANMLWPRNTWVREVCISLAEMDWQALPHAVAEEVRHANMGPATSVEEELAFNNCRRNMDSSRTGKLGRKAVWHRCLMSMVLEDSDRPQQRPTAADRVEAKKHFKSTLPDSIFDSRHVDFSLGEELIEQYLEQAKTGKSFSPSPQRYMLRPQALHALRECGQDYSKLRRAWHAKLAVQGHLLVSKDGATQAWVLEVSEFGVLTWGVQAFKAGGALRYLRLRPASDVPWRQIQVWDYAEWCSLEVEAMPPHLVARAKLQQGGKEKCGILLKCADKKPVPLLKAAAHTAFGNLTVAEMSRLVQDERVPYEGSRPTLEKDLVKLLVTWALPGLSSGDLENIMKLRTFMGPRLIQSVLTPENAEAVDGLLVEDDAAALKATVAARARKEKVHEIEDKDCGDHRSQAEEQLDEPEADRALGYKKKLDELEDKDCEVAAARGFLPQVKGCGISINNNERWQVRYDHRRAPGPKSWSQCWHPLASGMSNLDVLKRAIRWAWSVHLEDNPSADCPWDIEDV
jgi:hypothetical protein